MGEERAKGRAAFRFASPRGLRVSARERLRVARGESARARARRTRRAEEFGVVPLAERFDLGVARDDERVEPRDEHGLVPVLERAAQARRRGLVARGVREVVHDRVRLAPATLVRESHGRWSSRARTLERFGG